MSEHPAAVHQRSIALVRHAARRDHAAYLSLIAELTGPQDAAAQLLSLVQVAALLLPQMPEQEREQLLNEAALALAAQVDDQDTGGGAVQ